MGAISIQYWAVYVERKPKMRRYSEDAVDSLHVLQCNYDPESMTVFGDVQSSQKDKTYKVTVMLGDTYDVLMSACQCANAEYECHHVAALLLYAYRFKSKTDVPQQWLKHPKKHRESQTLAEMFPSKKPEYKALDRPVTDEDRKSMYEDLCKLGTYTAMQWILSPEPSAIPCSVPLMEDLLTSSGYLHSGNKNAWLRKECFVSPAAVKVVAERTKGQRKCPEWSAIRKYRLTASNFGDLLRAIRLGNFPVSLQKKLCSNFSLETLKSIRYGVNHEEVAIAAYQRQGYVVRDTGIWLHESGVLGASPDGLITAVGAPSQDLFYQTPEARTLLPQVLEVKCPVRAEHTTVRHLADNEKTFYLKRRDDGGLYLDEKHQYYHQVQGQLYLTNAICGDFVVWSPRDIVIIRIARDLTWQGNIAKLIEFFFFKFLPVLPVA